MAIRHRIIRTLVKEIEIRAEEVHVVYKVHPGPFAKAPTEPNVPLCWGRSADAARLEPGTSKTGSASIWRPSPNETISQRKQSGSEGGQDQLCSMPGPRRPRGCAGQSDAAKCHRRLPKIGLSQHSLAGRARSFIADFHALREPSIEEISLEFPVGPVLLTLFKSPGPLNEIRG